jgi:hypothetical protein
MLALLIFSFPNLPTLWSKCLKNILDYNETAYASKKLKILDADLEKPWRKNGNSDMSRFDEYKWGCSIIAMKKYQMKVLSCSFVWL